MIGGEQRHQRPPPGLVLEVDHGGAGEEVQEGQGDIWRVRVEEKGSVTSQVSQVSPGAELQQSEDKLLAGLLGRVHEAGPALLVLLVNCGAPLQEDSHRLEVGACSGKMKSRLSSVRHHTVNISSVPHQQLHDLSEAEAGGQLERGEAAVVQYRD